MIHEDWFSVYGEDFQPNPRDTKFRSKRSNLGTGDIYIFNCEFYKCESGDSHGGSIFVSSIKTTKALFEKCSFFKCKTTGFGHNGAAIYFGDEGNCTIFQACSYGCYSADSCAFSYVNCTNATNYKNRINDSSICYSESNRSAMTWQYYGDALMKGVNCSYNKNNRNCIYFFPKLFIRRFMFSYFLFCCE